MSKTKVTDSVEENQIICTYTVLLVSILPLHEACCLVAKKKESSLRICDNRDDLVMPLVPTKDGPGKYILACVNSHNILAPKPSLSTFLTTVEPQEEKL